MKKYILIAGVNGAGKSTLFYLLDELSCMPRVNTDDIVKNGQSFLLELDVQHIILLN